MKHIMIIGDKIHSTKDSLEALHDDFTHVSFVVDCRTEKNSEALNVVDCDCNLYL